MEQMTYDLQNDPLFSLDYTPATSFPAAAYPVVEEFFGETAMQE